MVEMQETAAILHQATPRSLVILDEIGRGTSTFDGLSIAWAVAEHLHDFQGVGVKTLFATHYHELTELARTFSRVHNLNVAIKEWQNEIIFFTNWYPENQQELRHSGGAIGRHSSGGHHRSREILNQLEQTGPGDAQIATLHPQRRKTRSGKVVGLQLSLFHRPLDVIRDQLLALIWIG